MSELVVFVSRVPVDAVLRAQHHPRRDACFCETESLVLLAFKLFLSKHSASFNLEVAIVEDGVCLRAVCHGFVNQMDNGHLVFFCEVERCRCVVEAMANCSQT